MRLARAVVAMLLLTLPLAAQTTFGTNSSVGSTLVGRANTAVLTIQGSAAFPNTQIGQSSQAVSIALINRGYVQAVISVITITGSNPGDFSQTNNCPSTLGGGASCLISVTFTPQAAGTRNALLSVVSDAPQSPNQTSLTGTGVSPSQPAVSMTPAGISFPDTVQGLTSAAQDVTLLSNGTAVLNISGVTITGTNSADFSQTNNCAAQLPVGASCHISITFTPSNTGQRTAQVNLASNAPSSPNVTTLSGTGTPISTPLSIDTMALSPGVQSSPYSDRLVGSGGVAPYTWSITQGSISACGLNLNSSTGVISGTPPDQRTCTATFALTDTVCVGTDCPTRQLSISIGSPSVGENAYCNSSEVFTGGSYDETAHLPTRCVNTDPLNTPSNGSTITVNINDPTNLQYQLNNAPCGSKISIPAESAPGVQAVYQAAFTITNRNCTASNWLTIQTSKSNSLPSWGTRMTPSWAGYDWPRSTESFKQYLNAPVHGVYIPKLRVATVNRPVIAISNSSYIRIQGLELTTAAGLNTKLGGLISGDTSDHIVMDRLWVHGGDSATEHSVNQVSQGIVGNDVTYWAVVNSRVTDIWCLAGGLCVDSNGLAGGNGTGGGPFKFLNNAVSASAEPIFLGGGTATGVPTDIEIRRNFEFHPDFWNWLDPSWDAVRRGCKNTGELKSGIRILYEGNIHELSWGMCVDQAGFAMLLGPKNQGMTSNGGTATSDGAGHLTWVSGPLFSPNQVAEGCATPYQCHLRWSGEAGFPRKVTAFTDTTHITISPAPAAGTAAFVYCLPGGGPTVQIADVTYRYNIMRKMRNGFQFSSGLSDCGDASLGIHRVSLHDTLMDYFDGPKYTLTGGCCTYDASLSLSFSQDNQGAVDGVIKHNTWLPYVEAGQSAGMSYLAVTNNNSAYTIDGLTIRDNIGLSGFRSADSAQGGKCYNVGGTAAVLACQSPNTYCWTGNVIATGTLNGWPANPLLSPFPTTNPAGGRCPGTAVNYSATDYNDIGFVNLNGANGGNYRLAANSKFKGVATDVAGDDPGAHIDLLDQFTRGVDVPTAVDMMDWVLMPLPDRTTQYLTGASNPKYFYWYSTAADRFWWIKGSTGNPWDINVVTPNSISYWITENGDSSQQAICAGDGYSSCWDDPNAYKRFVTPVPLMPRYYELNSGPIIIDTPGNNPIVRTTNCEVDAQAQINLGNIRGVLSGPFNDLNFGGTVGSSQHLRMDYYYGGSVSGGNYTGGHRERMYYVRGFGQVRWDNANWNSGTSQYDVVQTSTSATKTTGTVPAPNFPCGTGKPWW